MELLAVTVGDEAVLTTGCSVHALTAVVARPYVQFSPSMMR